MAPRLPPQPLNDPKGLKPPPSHRSSENQLLWSSEVASWVNFQPLTGHHPQHGHGEQLMMPQIPLPPQANQNTHDDQRWFEEEEVLQRYHEDHDHENQARVGDRETQSRREEAQRSQQFWAQIQDHEDEPLNENQELQGSQEMLGQSEEQMEQGRFGQERDGTIPSLATGFVHQRFQDLQKHQSPYDGHNLNVASNQVYFQQEPDQHGRLLIYQDTQHGDQDRRQNEGQPLQMGPSHVKGHKWKGQPSDDAVALPQRENDWSHLPPTCDDPPLTLAHLWDEEPYIDSLPEQMAYSHPDQQVQQSSWVARPVPSSLYSMNLDTVSPWDLSPQQVAYGQPNRQGQQSMHTSEPEQQLTLNSQSGTRHRLAISRVLWPLCLRLHLAWTSTLSHLRSPYLNRRPTATQITMDNSQRMVAKPSKELTFNSRSGTRRHLASNRGLPLLYPRIHRAWT